MLDKIEAEISSAQELYNQTKRVISGSQRRLMELSGEIKSLNKMRKLIIDSKEGEVEKPDTEGK